jgi:cell division protease FtsH
MQILEVHSKGKPLAEDVNMETVAKQTPGFSGADLANLVNESALLAARRNKESIGLEEFAESIDRVIAGPARRSRVISPREKRITAYHEAGHALVGQFSPHADPVFKVTIISRGQMGGYTRFLPEEDRSLWTKAQFKDRITSAMGGRAAEEIVFGEVTTGATNDLEQATNIARTMITRYGMSEKLGPRTFGKREELVFLGKEISEQRDYSDRVAETIDNEVHHLIENAYQTAVRLINSNRAKLDQLAEYLIEHESIEGEKLQALFESDSPPFESGTPPSEPDEPPSEPESPPAASAASA